MKPFLKKVADVYALNEADRLYKYCFVLPNRRSRVFFESYLSDALNDKHSIFPELTTISDFIDEYSDLVEAGVFAVSSISHTCGARPKAV